MFEFIACAAAVALFAAVWLAVYKLGGLDWTADATLADATAQLSAANFALDGETHGAAARLSPAAVTGIAARAPLFNSVAGQARLSMPVVGWNA